MPDTMSAALTRTTRIRRYRLVIGAWRNIVLPRSLATDSTRRLVPVRIELLLARHHHDQRRERVQHRDRVALRGEHVRRFTLPRASVRDITRPAPCTVE